MRTATRVHLAKKLPLLIEDVEKPDNTKLSLVKFKEHDGS